MELSRFPIGSLECSSILRETMLTPLKAETAAKSGQKSFGIFLPDPNSRQIAATWGVKGQKAPVCLSFAREETSAPSGRKNHRRALRQASCLARGTVPRARAPKCGRRAVGG